MNKEELEKAMEQFETVSEHFHQVANNHGRTLLEEITQALENANGDHDLLMSLFEDSGMWRHAMCLNDIIVTGNASN